MKRKTYRLGFLLDRLASPYHAALAVGVDSFARERGHDLTVFYTGRFGSSEDAEKGANVLFDLVDQKRFDGIILGSASLAGITGHGPVEEYLRRFDGLPIVSIGDSYTGIPSVDIDNSTGMKELVSHLVTVHGIRRFAFLTGTLEHTDARERFAAYREGLLAHGIPIDERLIYRGDFMFESGRLAVGELVRKRPFEIDAIIASNDAMAVGALQELKRREIRVPMSIALAGFDNTDLSLLNGLTTVDLPFERQAYEAAKTLESMLSGELPVLRKHLPSVLVRRTSCGCAIGASYGAPLRESEAASISMRYILDTRVLMLNDSGVRLFVSLEMETQMRAFHRGLRVIGIRAGRLALYVDPERPLALSRIILDFDGDDCRFFGAESEPVPTIDVLSFDLKRSDADDGREDTRRSHMVMDLYQGFNQIGLLLLDMDNQDPTILELIRQQASSALKANLLYRALKDQSRNLEDIIEARTGELKETNLRLQREIDERRHIEERLKEAMEELEHSNRKLHTESVRDELTGLYNRRGFFLTVEEEVTLALRHGRPFIVFYIDMDGLKSINDNFGHPEGDKAIRIVSQILGRSFRSMDILGRFGGDEFVVFAGDSDPSFATVILERLQRQIDIVDKNRELPYRVSFTTGYAVWTPPESVPIPPESVPIPPESVPIPPESVPVPPESVPVPPESVPVPPESVPVPPESVPVPPESIRALIGELLSKADLVMYEKKRDRKR